MSFAKHSLQTLLVRFTLMAIGIIGGIINARWLGPEGVGIYALLFLVQSFAFQFGNLGFGSAFAYFVAKKKSDFPNMFKLAWIIGLIMSILCCLVLVVIRDKSFSPWKGIEPQLFYICLITVPNFFLIIFIRRILSGQLRITVINISEVLNTIIMVTLLVVFVIILKMGVLGAVYALIISQLLAMFFLIHQSYRRKIDASSTHMGDAATIEENRQNVKHKSKLAYDLWRYGRWNYLVTLANYLAQQLPFIVLSWFASKAGVGFFSQARNLSMMTRIANEPFSKMLFPYTAASAEKEAVARTNMLCRTSLVAMLGFTLILVAVVKYLILILYGHEFLPSVPVFYALAPLIVLWPISQFLGVHVAASGSPKAVFATSVGGLITAILLCAFLIPVYDEVGAALSVSGIFFVLATLRLGVYMKYYGSPIKKILIPQKSDWAYCWSLIKRIQPSSANDSESGAPM
ncbi:MAG: lipopolysaccharide biosynthesis protein [Planctomycetota bacterium]|jgi:O-antigen/teichoic acid export membrane protein